MCQRTDNQSIQPYFFAVLVISFTSFQFIVALKRKASVLTLRDNAFSHSTGVIKFMCEYILVTPLGMMFTC
jgi:hypothetical protein